MRFDSVSNSIRYSQSAHIFNAVDINSGSSLQLSICNTRIKSFSSLANHQSLRSNFYSNWIENTSVRFARRINSAWWIDSNQFFPSLLIVPYSMLLYWLALVSNALICLACVMCTSSLPITISVITVPQIFLLQESTGELPWDSQGL